MARRTSQILSLLIALPVAEAVLAVALASVFYFQGQPMLSAMTAVIGAFVGVTRLAFQHYLGQLVEPRLKNLASYLDIETHVPVRELKDFVSTFAQITAPEFHSVKERILEEAREDLRRLAHEKRSKELKTTEYYAWLLPMMKEVGRGETVKAVSALHDVEWDDAEAERQFFQANLDIGQRGGRVERIFIIPEAHMAAAFANTKIAAHSHHLHNGLNGYVVSLEFLKRTDSGLLAEIGDGFIELRNRVVLVDRFMPEREVRGQVTMNPADLKHYNRLFDQLRLHAKALDLSPPRLEAAKAPVLLTAQPAATPT